MAVSATTIYCRTALRRQVDFLRPIRQQQRRAQSSKNDPKTNGAARKDDPIPTPNNVPTLPFWQRLGPLTRAAEAYARSQRKRPYMTQFCSSLVIYLFSDCALFPDKKNRRLDSEVFFEGSGNADWGRINSVGAKYGRERLRSNPDS